MNIYDRGKNMDDNDDTDPRHKTTSKKETIQNSISLFKLFFCQEIAKIYFFACFAQPIQKNGKKPSVVHRSFLVHVVLKKIM